MPFYVACSSFTLIPNRVNPPLFYNTVLINNFLALFAGDVQLLKCLLENTEQDVLHALHGSRRSKLPIVLATTNGYGNVVDALLARGVNVNSYAGGCCGETALHAAAKIGSTELVDQLLNAGACTDTRNARGTGHRPLEVAVFKHGYRFAVTALLIHSERLVKAVVQNDTDMVAFLLACGVTPNATTKAYGGTPLHIAVRHRQYEMMAILLSSNRCRTNILYNDLTALDLAQTMGDMYSISMIVNRKNHLPLSGVHTDR